MSEYTLKTWQVIRDLEAALLDPDTVRSGPDRDMAAARMHFRATPATLRKISDHLEALEELLKENVDGTEGRHYSLTLALLPLRGRGGGQPEEESP